MRIFCQLFLALSLSIMLSSACSRNYDFTKASVLIQSDMDSSFRSTLIQIMDEEISQRSSVTWEMADRRNTKQAQIILALDTADAYPPEGYRIFLDSKKGKNTLWITGADKRGLLYGIGHLFKIIRISENRITLPASLDITTSPAYPIRGHQLGYRNTANSWDAWTVEQYDRYIRELVLLGSNCIEDIPFQSDSQSVHMLMPHREMHIEISGICKKYDVDTGYGLRQGETWRKKV